MARQPLPEEYGVAIEPDLVQPATIEGLPADHPSRSFVAFMEELVRDFVRANNAPSHLFQPRAHQPNQNR